MKNFTKRRKCLQCEQEFTITGANARYCSAICMLQYRSTQIGDCWVWRNGKEWTGYQITWRGEPCSARALALSETGVDVRPGSIYSACGNGECINPAHLTQDPALRGPRRKHKMLTKDQLAFVRTSREASATLAQRYGVCTTTIQRHRKAMRRIKR